MSTKLMDYFNKMPRLGCLRTANKEGKVRIPSSWQHTPATPHRATGCLCPNATFRYIGQTLPQLTMPKGLNMES
jgi:hypothetical protein